MVASYLFERVVTFTISISHNGLDVVQDFRVVDAVGNKNLGDVQVLVVTRQLQVGAL